MEDLHFVRLKTAYDAEWVDYWSGGSTFVRLKTAYDAEWVDYWSVYKCQDALMIYAAHGMVTHICNLYCVWLYIQRRLILRA